MAINSRKNYSGYLFIAPWLFGFFVFTAFPVVSSFLISFCKWNMLMGMSHIKWIGLENYIKLMGFHHEGVDVVANDPLFWQSLKVTFLYSLFGVPIGMIASISLALLMNQKIKGIYFFRTIYYLPAITSGVATAVLWKWIFNPEFGLLNYFLDMTGIGSILRSTGIGMPLWLASPTMAMPAFIFMSLWGIGGPMVIYLAGLQGIPRELYEVAELDGAGIWRKFLNVTLPMLSPTIFFNLIISIIGSFQVFTQALIMTNGGPSNATLFYVLYLYRHAFVYYKMGYASAMAWILFAIVLFFTLIQFRMAKRWVHYQGTKI